MSGNLPEDDYDDYGDGSANCPHCGGLCEVPCYCGGDLCVCENNGYEECPVCQGDGVVSIEVYDRYLEKQRRNAEAFREVLGDALKAKP